MINTNTPPRLLTLNLNQKARLNVDVPENADGSIVAQSGASHDLNAIQKDYDLPIIDPITCLAVVIYLEARGEPLQGRIAVADTVMTRALHEGMTRGHDTCAVVQAPGQYAVTGRIDYQSDEWASAVAVSAAVVWGGVGCRCATHFHTLDIDPYWADSMSKVAVIGDHIFYMDE
jgi:spore germination cell wall hydrolase CwlJ-like protein